MGKRRLGHQPLRPLQHPSWTGLERIVGWLEAAHPRPPWNTSNTTSEEGNALTSSRWQREKPKWPYMTQWASETTFKPFYLQTTIIFPKNESQCSWSWIALIWSRTKINAVYSIGISEPECKAVRIYKMEIWQTYTWHTDFSRKWVLHGVAFGVWSFTMRDSLVLVDSWSVVFFFDEQHKG